jgi:hypothetical protein
MLNVPTHVEVLVSYAKDDDVATEQTRAEGWVSKFMRYLSDRSDRFLNLKSSRNVSVIVFDAEILGQDKIKSDDIVSMWHLREKLIELYGQVDFVIPVISPNYLLSGGDVFSKGGMTELLSFIKKRPNAQNNIVAVVKQSVEQELLPKVLSDIPLHSFFSLKIGFFPSSMSVKEDFLLFWECASSASLVVSSQKFSNQVIQNLRKG